MKKKYYQPEWKLVVVEEDVITASGDFFFGEFTDNDECDGWEW